MKKILLFSFIVLFVSPVFTQTRPPKRVRQAFEKMVPNAQDVIWSTPKERESAKNKKYTANYVVDTDSIFSRFDNKGNWLMTVTYMPIDELPEEVRSSVYTNYSDSKLTKAARMEEPDFDGYGVIFIYSKSTWTVQISKEGKIVRRKVQSNRFSFI